VQGVINTNVAEHKRFANNGHFTRLDTGSHLSFHLEHPLAVLMFLRKRRLAL
jgi:hypothetical protein